MADAKKDDDSPGPGFLFHTSAPPDRTEILSSLPPRLAADRIVSRYFNSNDPALRELIRFTTAPPQKKTSMTDLEENKIDILHGPTFQKDVSRPVDGGLDTTSGLTLK